MKFRRENEISNSKTMKCLINPEKLNLEEYKAEKLKLMSFTNGIDKINYISEYLQNEIPLIDIFSNNYNTNLVNEANEPNELVQYFLIYMLCIFRKNFMKKIFPKNDIKKNIITLPEDESVKMSKKFFQILFSLIFTTKSETIRFTAVELLLAYSEESDNFVDYCLDDNYKYISKIFYMTYLNNEEIISDSIIILINIIIDKQTRDYLDEILQINPIIQRCQEILDNNSFGVSLKNDVMELLGDISEKIDKDYYENYFENLIPTFLKVLQEYNGKEQILESFLIIASNITNSSEICKKIITVGLGDGLYQLLKVTDLSKKNLKYTLMIFSNLFYENEIIIYFIMKNSLNGNISKKDDNIINTLVILIKTYINTANQEDVLILKEILFCLSNIVTGPKEAKMAIYKSEIPELVIQIMKLKKDNKIYFEGLHFFYNIIYECDAECYDSLLKLRPFILFGKGLENTGNVDNLILCLKGIILIYEKNVAVYHDSNNLRNDYISCMLRRKLNELANHKNEEIATYAEKIINLFDNSMNTE